MTAFRLALIPAGVAGDAVGELVAVMRQAPRGRTSAAVDEVLGALANSDAGQHYTVRSSGSRGALITVCHPEDFVLEPLLILAKDHGLAVYDIDLKRLYDPADGVDVDVTVPGLRLPFLTRELLVDLVGHPRWPDPEAPFVVVDRAREDFIQVWCHDDGAYQLEYREGGPESHFRASTEDAGVVVDVMWAWVIGDPRWRVAVDWMFVDLEAEAAAAGR